MYSINILVQESHLSLPFWMLQTKLTTLGGSGLLSRSELTTLGETCSCVVSCPSGRTIPLYLWCNQYTPEVWPFCLCLAPSRNVITSGYSIIIIQVTYPYIFLSVIFLAYFTLFSVLYYYDQPCPIQFLK